MNVCNIVAPKDNPCKFTHGDLYIRKHSVSNLLYIGARVNKQDVLINLSDGGVWSLLSPFGNVGPVGFMNVTDLYKVVSV